MLSKKQLHELSIITGTIDDVSAVNIDMLKNHVLSNWTLNNRLADNDFKVTGQFFAHKQKELKTSKPNNEAREKLWKISSEHVQLR